MKITIFSKKRWNAVKTRKKMLIFGIMAAVTYCVTGLIMTAKGVTFTEADTLTTSFYSFIKWLIAGSATVTVAKVIKGNTNSDDDEKGE